MAVNLLRILASAGTPFVILYIIYLLSDIFTPFVISFILAYLLNPLVDRMEAKRIPRGVSIIILIAVAGGLISLLAMVLIPIIGSQVQSFAAEMPKYINVASGWFEPMLKRLAEEGEGSISETILQIIVQFGDLPLRLIKGLTAMAVGALTNIVYMALVVINLLVIPVATFYLLKDFDRLKEKFLWLIPERNRQEMRDYFAQVDLVLGNFMRGQLSVAAILSAIYAWGLYLVGTPMGVAIGIISGGLNIVPYVGFAIGLVLSLGLTFLKYADIVHLLYVCIVFGFAQVLDGAYLTPKLVGHRVGLHPVAALIAIVFLGKLFGFLGVLLAVPTAAVLNVFLKGALSKYMSSKLYDDRL